MPRAIPGTKDFGEPGGTRGKKGTTDEARVREVTLDCGCVKLFKVLPSTGDVVYCGRRHGFVKVPDRRTAKRRKGAAD